MIRQPVTYAKVTTGRLFINDVRFPIGQVPKPRGIIGNALLVREYAIVIDIPGRRMGFIRSVDLAHE